MKTALSLVQLAQELERQEQAKRDFIAPTSQLSMTVTKPSDNTGLAQTQLYVPGAGVDRDQFDLRDHAHGQLAAHLDIPKRYYDRMRGTAPDLLASNVNKWLGSEAAGARRMVRVLDGRVRAVLSDRYQRIENQEIARVALPVLADVPDMQVVSSEITETRLYIKAVFPRVQGEVAKGDVVQSGVMISNSEVGSGAVSVTPFMYRLVCLNGMVRADERFRGFHIGAKAQAGESVYELLTDETRRQDDKAILLKLRDVVAATANEAYFAKAVARFREAAGERIEGNVVQAVEVLAKNARMVDQEKADVLRHLIEGGDLSRWGLANAVTRAAHDPASYDRATELEALGGQIIDLPATQWREIAMAA